MKEGTMIAFMTLFGRKSLKYSCKMSAFTDVQYIKFNKENMNGVSIPRVTSHAGSVRLYAITMLRR